MQVPFLEQQLEIIRYLQQIRSPILDQFFIGLNSLDTDWYWLFVATVAGAIFRKTQHCRIFYFIFISAVINYILKAVLQEPRPFHLDPSLGLVEVGYSSMPSGAAQGAMLFGLALVYTYRRLWSVLVAVAYVSLLGLSRVYLGVHFPLDVLVGYGVGAIVFSSYFWMYRPIEKSLNYLDPVWRVMPPLLIAVVLSFILSGEPLLAIWCWLMGIAVNFYLLDKLCFPSNRKEWKFSVLRVSFAALGAIAILYSSSQFPSVLKVIVRLAGTTTFATVGLAIYRHLVERKEVKHDDTY